MGAFHSAEFSIAGVNAADAVLFNLKAAASGPRPRLLLAAFFVETAPSNAPQFGIKRMNAVGTGAITAAAIAAHDPNEVALAALETAWATTRPTVVGGSFTRGQVPTAIGNGLLYDFTSRPLIVPLSGGLCGVMRNAAGATLGVLGGHITWEE